MDVSLEANCWNRFPSSFSNDLWSSTTTITQQFYNSIRLCYIGPKQGHACDLHAIWFCTLRFDSARCDLQSNSSCRVGLQITACRVRSQIATGIVRSQLAACSASNRSVQSWIADHNVQSQISACSVQRQIAACTAVQSWIADHSVQSQIADHSVQSQIADHSVQSQIAACSSARCDLRSDSARRDSRSDSARSSLRCLAPLTSNLMNLNTISCYYSMIIQAHTYVRVRHSLRISISNDTTIVSQW